MKSAAIAILSLIFAGVLGAQSFTMGATPDTSLPDVDAKIWDVIEYNNKLYIAGEFTTVGTTTRNNLAEIDLTNNQVTSWNPDPDLFCTSLAVHNGTLYVGGGFTQIAGQARESLASFNLSTGALSSWNPTCALPAGASNIYFDDDVHCLELVGDTLYAGGGFTAIDGTPRGHVCSFDLNNLATNNGLTSWDPNIIGSIGSGSPSYGSGGVQAMYIDTSSNRCIMTGGILEAGGNHWHDGSSSGHTTVYSYAIVASTIGSGAPIGTWTPDFGTGAVLANTLIVNTCFGIGNQAYISGLFTTITAGGTTENRLVAAGVDITADTSTTNPTTSFNPNPDLRIWAWETDSNNDVIFAGGGFTVIGGQNYAHLAMLDPTTGNALGSWSPNPDNYVRALHFSGDKLFVAGEFTQIGGVAKQRLTSFDVTYANNNAPTLDVTSSSNSVGNGGTLNVQQYSTLNSLGLEIAVDDLDGDPVTLTGTVSGVGTTGILQSEFNQASGATPYSLYPSAGVFDSVGTHTITLAASDGKGGNTSLSFSVVVSAGNAAPTIQVSVLMSPMSNGGSVPVEWAAPMSSLGIAITVDDADGDPVTLVGSITPKGTTGTLDSEFTSIAQYGPYTLAPLTGQFTDPNTTHTVTLTADDGQGGITQFTFDLNVGDTPNSSDGGSGGGSSGGGGCAGATGSQAPLWLLAAMAALLGTAALHRRRQA